MERRTFLANVAGLPAALLAQQTPPPVQGGGAFVRRDTDRFGESRNLPAGNPMWFKVATRDTAGAFFLLEQTNTVKGGGPPRHFHHEQDEWFYSVSGDYVVEIGDRRYELSAGDSILAPRRVPHAFAFAGGAPGRLLVGFTPAGRMEEFFREMQERGAFFGTGTPEDRARLRNFGMEHVGPPLAL